MRIWVWAAVVALGFSAVAWAQTPAGGEFRVNTFTNSEQTHPPGRRRPDAATS